MKYPTFLPLAGGVWLYCCAPVIHLLAQEPLAESSPVPELESTVVTATRFPVDPRESGNSISVLDTTVLRESQIDSLDEALRLSPGTITSNTGQRGAAGSLFLRGTNSNQAQLVIDGVRVTDANTGLGSFLGASRLHGLDRIEILRGPQSALYGGEAIGGVVTMFTAPGEGSPTHRILAEAGSFGSYHGRFESQGSLENGFAYSLNAGHEYTNNHRSHNEFENSYFALRLDQNIGDGTRIGLTVRGADRRYQSPGSIYDNDPDNVDSDLWLLGTVFAEHQVNELWNTRLLFGNLRQDFDFRTAPGVSTGIKTRKQAVEWRNRLEWETRGTTVLGIAVEESDVTNSGFGNIDERESFVALYAQHHFSVGGRLHLTLGGRWEDYDSFGTEWTMRAAAAFSLTENTTLRAGYGTGFRAPSFFELYAKDAFFVGNTALNPETARGWDVGISHKLGEHLSMGLTWFEIRMDDLITTDFGVNPATVVNLEKAGTQGIEMSLAGKVLDRVTYRLSYTWLEADNLSAGRRLLRRPRHTLGFDVRMRLTDRFGAGFGMHLVRDSKDIHAQTFDTVSGDDYFVGRLFAQYQHNENLRLHLRIENVLDADYEEVNGYPGLPFGLFGGMSWKF